MSWFPIIALAVVTLGFAILVLKLEKRGWTMFAAVITFGLAGYATQGAPEMPGAPKEAQVIEKRESGEALVQSRRAMFNPDLPQTPYLTLSDGQARAGDFAAAAEFLRKGVNDNPQHAEAWLALGNALVEHAEGNLTPASLYAYGKAEVAAPGHPGIAYYLGVALIRSGRPVEARGVWTEMLANAPEDAPFRAELTARIERLDAMLAQSGVQSAPLPSDQAQTADGQTAE